MCWFFIKIKFKVGWEWLGLQLIARALKWEALALSPEAFLAKDWIVLVLSICFAFRVVLVCLFVFYIGGTYIHSAPVLVFVFFFFLFFNLLIRGREMAHQLRVVTGLPEDWGSIPRLPPPNSASVL